MMGHLELDLPDTVIKDIAATPIGAVVKHHLESEVGKVTE
jgi:hypothetical protein